MYIRYALKSHSIYIAIIIIFTLVFGQTKKCIVQNLHLNIGSAMWNIPFEILACFRHRHRLFVFYLHIGAQLNYIHRFPQKRCLNQNRLFLLNFTLYY